MKNSSRVVLLFSVLLNSTSSLFGQLQLSTIRGAVTDASGSAVVGGRVSVTDIKTNVAARTAIVDADGNFEFPDLVAGVYRVSIEATGFKSFVADNLVLAGSQIRRIDARLEIGQLAEQVTVQAGVTPITTDSAQITSSVGRQAYDDSPMVRNYYPHSMLATLPGVESQGSGWNMNINGQPPSQVALGMDGVTNDGTVNLVNRLDFSELTVTGVSNTADQPRVANYNMISKRGDNGFHGEAYFTHFNSAMNARNFFDPVKPATKEHRGQIAFSGPIIKNKTFFYVSYFYLKIPAGAFLQRNVANLAFRGGDFSQLAQAVRDPATGQPFPGNIIPASRINATSAKIQDEFLPKPNLGAPADLVNNFGYIHPFPSDLFEARYPQVRFDHNFSQKNSIFGRYIRRRTPYVLSSQLPQFVWTRFRSHAHTVITDTHIFSPKIINSFRFGLKSDFIEDGNEIAGVKPLQATDTIQKMGLQGVNQTGLKNVQGSPTLNITGFTGFSMPGGGIVNDNHQYSYADSLTWSVGRHILKFGGELKTVQEFLGSIPDGTFGNFNFNGTLSGNAYADFLLGMPFTSSRLSPLVNRDRREKEFGMYITDSYKVSQKLSIDYGVRWDYFTAPRFADGLQYAWDRNSGNVVIPENTTQKVSPLYPKNINVVTGKVLPSPDKGNLRPRFGFAYRLRDKSVVRGGYGVFTEAIGYFSRLQGVGPFQISETYNNQGPDGRPFFAFPNPFPSNLASAAIPSQSIGAFPSQTNNGIIHQFNLTLEQQIGDLGLRLSYVGSRNRGLNYNMAINKPQPSVTPFTQARRPYPQFLGVTEAQSDGRSNFNSVQFEVQRKVGSIITFDAHYTLQSHLSDFLNLENPYNHRLWNRETFSARHRAVFSTTIKLPFGKGQPFLAAIPSAADLLIGGWRVNTISTITSGQFFSPGYAGADPSNTNTVGGLPDRICDGNLSRDERSIARWFDPKCFAVPTSGRFGNSGVNVLKRPGYVVHHLTLAKDFRLSERFKLEYVASVANLFNHGIFNPPISNISTAGTGQITSILVGADLSIEGTRARELGMTLRLRW